MPYSSVQALPAEVKKKYTSKQLSAFRQAFNSALKDGKSEEQAFKIAHAAARRIGKSDKSDEQARNFSDKERKKLAQQGKAMSDGSFPIVTKADLKNAIQALGRTSEGKRAKVKAHITKRAKALGATNLLPDSWKSGDKAMSSVECPSCPRHFLDQAALVDHAEAVHTLSEKRSLVSRAVRASHGKDAYMVDLSDDWLIYDIYQDGEYKLYKQSYSLDNAGNVKITGDSKEVVRKIAYIPAPKVEVASSSLGALDIALATSVNGVPPSDAPHQFAQEEPAFDPNICTDCGRHKVHALHTNTADKADEQASASQTTVELSKQGKESDSKKKGSGSDTFICPSCKDKFPSDGDLKDHRKKKGH